MISPASEQTDNPYDWVIDYMCANFAPKAYGPVEFDCWGLVWHVSKFQAGIELPRFDDVAYQMQRIDAEIKGQALSDDWHEVKQPGEFDIALMQRAGEAYHVGICLKVDGGRILHACPEGILCNTAFELNTMGFQHITFWHYGNN
jgi:cell wall-associated NlpC family hydrolase